MYVGRLGLAFLTFFATFGILFLILTIIVGIYKLVLKVREGKAEKEYDERQFRSNVYGSLTDVYHIRICLESIINYLKKGNKKK